MFWQRCTSTFLIVALVAGLLPAPAAAQITPGYNPYAGQGRGYHDSRYDRTGGQRYNPDYYRQGQGYQGGHGFTRLIPPLVGGVVGLAMGAKFGLVGAVIGGAIGVFGGQAINHAVFGDSYYSSNSAYNYPGSGAATSWIPGAVGALIGAFMGSSFGMIGMVVGGGIGFLAGRAVSRLLFPNHYYGYGAYNVPGAWGGMYNRPYASQDSASATIQPAAVAPTAAKASESVAEGDLADLKSALYDSMSAYKDALTGDDAAVKESARADFLAAQRAYFDAKETLLGEQ